MKYILNFDSFINENSMFEAKIDNQRVVIFPGRFQPFHNGHIAALKKANDIFNLPVVPVQILSKTEKSPFPDKLLQEIGNSVSNEFNWMAGYCLLPTHIKSVIPQMVKYVREELNLNPVSMGCGSDRYKSYISQISYINSDKSDVPVSEVFRLEICDERLPNGPSGTKVRQAIAADDYILFKEMTPKSVHKFYNELKKYITQ